MTTAVNAKEFYDRHINFDNTMGDSPTRCTGYEFIEAKNHQLCEENNVGSVSIDEGLIGQTLNTNAAFIGENLIKNGIDVSESIVIGDDEESIINEFRSAFEKSKLIIVTGGLGPTHDDLTLDCIVKLFNTELVESEEVLTDIKNIFEKRGRKLTPSNI